MEDLERKVAYYHLPGLFEFYELYKLFLPLYENHREFFYEWCQIGSIYGAPAECLWGGGRLSLGNQRPQDVKNLMDKYHISSRLTFSNSLLQQNHLQDEKCNRICSFFESENNGVIITSDLLMEHIRNKYPKYFFISSTTKVITDGNQFVEELNCKDYKYVVADFRLNKRWDIFKELSQNQKDKIELLCNECCWIGCNQRKKCYENVSMKNLDENVPDHICKAPQGQQGYRFSLAMKNPSFISVEDVQSVYLPMGIQNFKIEGRGLGSALVLELLLYYMVKPEYQLIVREEIYLDNMLDLF